MLVFKNFETESKNENLTHTLLRKFLISNINNFKNYFAPYLDSLEQQEIATQAFENYKTVSI